MKQNHTKGEPKKCAASVIKMALKSGLHDYVNEDNAVETAVRANTLAFLEVLVSNLQYSAR